MRSDCAVCRAEGFEAQAQVEVVVGSQRVLAILHRVDGEWLGQDEAALSDAAWHHLQVNDGDPVYVRHPRLPESLGHLRAKVYGQRLDQAAMRALIQDICQGLWSELHLAAFVTACAGGRLDHEETVALTRAMIDAGDRLLWQVSPVMDKHCVGGLPGNRTTLVVVPIVTACGVLMPKTSSRAITSPAGTADAMETLAPVALDAAAMRRVVEREGGCIVWGAAAKLSPADDMLIRVERPLDLDSEAQLVASVLSKKAAAGSDRVLIDLPVGPTAKVRSPAAAASLAAALVSVGEAIGLEIRTMVTDGSQPVGRGIGPALEALDVLAVLERRPDAPQDLRTRSLLLAGVLLEMAHKATPGDGMEMARSALDDGRALAKFISICEAQGGMRVPPRAPHWQPVCSTADGRVVSIDNRRLARAAKLAGAPRDAAAGATLHVRIGERVQTGQPLFTMHAQSPGELAYALDYVRAQAPMLAIEALGLIPCPGSAQQQRLGRLAGRLQGPERIDLPVGALEARLAAIVAKHHDAIAQHEESFEAPAMSHGGAAEVEEIGQERAFTSAGLALDPELVGPACLSRMDAVADAGIECFHGNARIGRQARDDFRIGDLPHIAGGLQIESQRLEIGRRGRVGRDALQRIARGLEVRKGRGRLAAAARQQAGAAGHGQAGDGNDDQSSHVSGAPGSQPSQRMCGASSSSASSSSASWDGSPRRRRR